MSHILSKSTYLWGVKCEKSLHLHKYNKHLKDEVSEDQEAACRFGDKVCNLAQKLFPGGIDVTPDNFYDYSKSLVQTKNVPHL